ncbi:MAG: hypothetical protein H6835_11820 [Planctomycetes bacterium]|nr:hypothetical protein [Planctomycetota bacterium]
MPVLRLRTASLTCTLALTLTACGSDTAGESTGTGESDAVRQQTANDQGADARRVAELEQQVARLRPRAGAYLHLEFLGDAPVLDGKRTVLEVLATSAAPEAATSDYPDCLAVNRCKRVADADEVLVVSVAFHDRRATSAFRLEVGSHHSAILVPWEEMPESVRSIQRVDETDRFDLPIFAAIGLQPASEPRTLRPAQHGDLTIGREEAIATSIARIEALERQHGSFAEWQAELAGLRVDLATRLKAEGSPLVDGTRIALRNLHYITHEPDDRWPAPQVAFFVALRDQLAARNVDLIVAPFPEKEQLATLLMSEQPPADGITHPYRLFWHLSLLRAGIEVVDLLPALIAASQHHANVFYDAVDGHPADGGIMAAAAEIAPRLRRYTELPHPYSDLQYETVRYSIPDSFELFPPRSHNADCYEATSVVTSDGQPLPRQMAKGPVLLLGDSFVGVPTFYGVPAADIASHLVAQTGIATRRRSIGGSAPQLMVHLAKECDELLDGVRVLIFLFREDYMFDHRPDEAKYRWQVSQLPATRR